VVPPDQVVGEPGWVVDGVEQLLDRFVVALVDEFVEPFTRCAKGLLIDDRV